MRLKQLILKTFRASLLLAGGMLLCLGLAGPLLRTNAMSWDYRPQGSPVPTRGMIYIDPHFVGAVIEWVSLEPPPADRVIKKTFGPCTFFSVPYVAVPGHRYHLRSLSISRVDILFQVLGVVVLLHPVSQLIKRYKNRLRCRHCDGDGITGRH